MLRFFVEVGQDFILKKNALNGCIPCIVFDTVVVNFFILRFYLLPCTEGRIRLHSPSAVKQRCHGVLLVLSACCVDGD